MCMAKMPVYVEIKERKAGMLESLYFSVPVLDLGRFCPRPFGIIELSMKVKSKVKANSKVKVNSKEKVNSKAKSKEK